MLSSSSSDSDDFEFRDCATNEWQRMKEARLKEGYRDGITKGEEETLQRGFNKGYAESLPKIMKITYLKGIVSALQTHKSIQSEMSTDAKELNILLERITKLEMELKENRTGIHSKVESVTMESEQNVEETKMNEAGALSTSDLSADQDQQLGTINKLQFLKDGKITKIGFLELSKETVATESSRIEDIYEKCCKFYRKMFDDDMI
ncbi:uncharacterized protein LOC102807485 [Saccoglossus kowalevskii]|uniref:Uncharacterized protein LOC102807485 n=1 Tax=Saccoglossus kowalevskii TaxID=10224 RepID=A0ABM0MES9_SACKO|nr:PREDICTED: uncharacterized protein LOC102807485 [Saccoglossus kowalevskii]